MNSNGKLNALRHPLQRPPIWLWVGVLLALLLLLTACGGGAGGVEEPGPEVNAVPPAVTATVSTAGSSVDVELGGGARAALVFGAGAFATDRAVTVTPLAPSDGEWTRFTIEPGVAQMRAPLLVRVRPPASVTADQVPVLQLITADGPVLLQTKRLADGLLEAEVLPQLAGALASTGRARALAARRPLADGDGGATTLAGTGFLAVCELPQPTIDDARNVILNASRASQVRTAIGTLAMLKDRCSSGAAPGALAALAAQIPGLYADALRDWQAVNYLSVEAEAETFRRGVRRLLALCAAAGELGAELVCPLSPDFDPEYTEIANGFAAAANERENTGDLRVLFDQVAALPAEAELLGLPQAAPALRDAVGLIADRLMDRAYALCNGSELFEWLGYVDGGGASRRSAESLRKGLAYCGLSLAASQRIVNGDGSVTLLGEVQFTPGSLDGAGRSIERTLTVPFDGEVFIDPEGGPTRCSRVIGAPEGRAPLLVRVGTVDIGALTPFGADRAFFGRGFSIPAMLGAIGRSADSTDPIRVDVYRSAESIAGCSDSFGGTLTIAVPELLLYSLTLQPRPSPLLEVSIILPSTLSGATNMTVRTRDPRTGTPAAGAAVSFTVTNGSVSSGGVTNAEGQLSATLAPFGLGSVTVTAHVVATDGGTGGATATAAMQLPQRWTGRITMTQTYRVRINDDVDVREFSAFRDVEVDRGNRIGSFVFKVLAQGGSASTVSTQQRGGCSITETLSGPVSTQPDGGNQRHPDLDLFASGSYRIKFGSVIAVVSGTRENNCVGTRPIQATIIDSVNQAEPQGGYALDAAGAMHGSETRVVRAGDPDGIVFQETTRTVTWSLSPR